MIYIGIDPGKKGAFAIIDGDLAYSIPFDEKTFIGEMRMLVYEKEKKIACLEHVHAMPGQGVNSMFTFGQGFGFIQGVLTALSIPYELVTPQKWKKEFSITSDKNTSIEVCKRMFPEVSLRPDRARKDSDGMAEALLMAEYARRKFGR